MTLRTAFCAVLLGALAAAAAPPDDPVFETLGTVDLAPRGAGSLAYHRPANLLLCTDTALGEIHLLRAERWAPPSLATLDAFPASDSTEAIPVPGLPTSVAVAPTQPLALAVTVALNRRERGSVLFIDLRDKSPGRILRSQPVGIHPDSVAVAPDGRWALVANEAENDPETAGSIGMLDLRNLEGWAEDHLAPVPYRELAGLADLLGVPAGSCEPEFVAFEPRGRCAAVSCQENDAVVLVDLQADEPSLAGVLRLPPGAQPDGVALVDDAAGPEGRIGILLAVAEEGKESQSVSFHWIDPARLSEPPALLARIDVRPLVNMLRPGKRRDPNAVAFYRTGGHTYAFVNIERGKRVLCFDVTDPHVPELQGRAAVGVHPEGLITIEQPDGCVVLTGNRGEDGPGSISVLRLRNAP